MKDDEVQAPESIGSAVLSFVALAAFVGLTVWLVVDFWQTPSLSGKHHSLLDALLFFGREALLALFFGAVLCVVVVAMLVQASLRLLAVLKQVRFKRAEGRG